MWKKKIIVVVGVRVGSVDTVNRDQHIEFSCFLTRDHCGESWGLTLGNPCMQSP
jgi:hypothetical protein